VNAPRALLRRVHGTAVVVRAAYGQRRIPYLPWPDVEALRDERVRELARYAADTVPHYRELFRAQGIDPRALTTAADLERLPVLTKETLRADPDRFVSESAAGRTSVPFTTSGTTGLRLRIHHDRRSLLLNTAFRERQRHVEVHFTGKELRALRLSIGRPGGTGRKVRGLLDDTTVLLRQRRRRISSVQPVEQILAEVNRFRPDIVRSAGSTLELLFRTAAATGARLHRPRVAVYGDDMMTSEGKELIETRFGVPVISHYNAVEAFQLGYTCEERRGFHLYADLTHVSVLPEGAAHPVREGRGIVVVSNLVNHGTVLLNYRLGDVATLTWDACPCGRTGPLLTELEGRAEDRIRLADGTLVSPRRVWDVIRPHESVVRYQLVQSERRRFRLRLATETDADFAAIADGVVAELRSLLGGAEVEAAFDPSLAAPVEAKFRPVVALPEEPA
jgi:phenylacetate-CoA ligase